MRVVTLVRVSTDEQAGQDGSGLDRQRHEVARTVARLGAQVLKSFHVIGVSRTSVVSTPEWKEISELVREPGVGLVVDRIDRLAADLSGYEILAYLKATRTTIYTGSGDVDPTTQSGTITGVLQSMMASLELDGIRHRSATGREAKRRRGLHAGSDIALATGIAFVREKGLPGRWTYNEDAARVRQAFALVLEGHTNLTAVARMTGLGSSTAVRGILRNPIYRGLWRIDEKRDPNKRPIGPDGRRRDRPKVPREPHEVIEHQVYRPRGEPRLEGDEREEALVSAYDWEQVQSILQQKTEGHFAQRDPKDLGRFIYSGLLVCSECGRRLTSKTKSDAPGRRRDFYACLPREGGERCQLRYVRRETLHRTLDALVLRVVSPEFIERIFEEAPDNGGAEDALRSAKTRIAQVRAKKERLTDAFVDGALEPSSFKSRSKAFDAELGALERDAERARIALDERARFNSNERLRQVLLTLGEFEFFRGDQKRAVVRRVFRRIVISKNGVEAVDVRVSPSPDTLVEVGRFLQVAIPWVPKPAPRITALGVPEASVYTKRDVCKILGITPHQFYDRVAKGVIPPATHRRGPYPAWSPEELSEMRRAFGARAEEASKLNRWGTPKKDLYSRGDVARILSLPYDRFRYLLDSGQLPEPQGRDGRGRHVWTEGEVEDLVRLQTSRPR